MIINPGLRRAISGTLRLSNIVRQIFAGGINGAIYDPSQVVHLNQLSSGATPVTAVTNPVGLVLDSRLGLALGPELVDTINTVAGWTAYGTNIVTQDGDAVKVTFVDHPSGAQAYLSSGGGLGSDLTVGASYKITYDVKINGGSCSTTAVNTVGNNNETVTSTAYIQQSFVFVASHASLNYLAFDVLSAGEIVWIKNISVKLLDGNHAVQPTAAARPTWQVDANGKYYLSFLGVDDNLTSATGGGGTAGFFWCGAVQPTGGGGIFRVLFDDSGTNTGYLVYLAASNVLGLRAGNGTAYTYATSPGAISVGTKYMLTAWDDGVNLNVQVNNGTISSTARPSVAAGTNAFSLLKTNGAAADYFIGNLYPSIYMKNTAGTAAERAAIQAWVKSKAGL